MKAIDKPQQENEDVNGLMRDLKITQQAAEMFIGAPHLKISIPIIKKCTNNKLSFSFKKDNQIINNKTFVINPPTVRTIYRVAVYGADVPHFDMELSVNQIVLPEFDKWLKLLSEVTGSIIQNNEDVPDKSLIETINNYFSSADTLVIMEAAVNSKDMEEVFGFYGLSGNKKLNSKAKTFEQVRHDSLPHSSIGSACKYFGWTPQTVMNMTWDNLMLYMASIPRYDDEGGDTGSGGKMPETKNVWDLF